MLLFGTTLSLDVWGCLIVFSILLNLFFFIMVRPTREESSSSIGAEALKELSSLRKENSKLRSKLAEGREVIVRLKATYDKLRTSRVTGEESVSELERNIDLSDSTSGGSLLPSSVRADYEAYLASGGSKRPHVWWAEQALILGK